VMRTFLSPGTGSLSVELAPWGSQMAMTVSGDLHRLPRIPNFHVRALFDLLDHLTWCVIDWN